MRIYVFLLLLSGCAKPTPWQLDSIAAVNKSFDSSRLIYHSIGSDSPLRVEFLRIGTSVELFLNLAKYSISPSPFDPFTALVQLKIGDDPPLDEPALLLEGKMRLRLSQETASRVTKALQDGKKVGILVDGFQEIIEPEQFQTLYEKLTSSPSFFQNLIKGPV